MSDKVKRNKFCWKRICLLCLGIFKTRMLLLIYLSLAYDMYYIKSKVLELLKIVSLNIMQLF